MSDDTKSPSRRSLIKSLVFMPMGVGVAGALQSCGKAGATAAAGAPEGKPDAYTPSFFNAAEWAFLGAAVDRLIPHDEHGPGAIESGVLEFLDRHMKTPYANGGIWYMQGPFLEAPSEFGYQGKLPLCDILRVGIKSMDAYCVSSFSGKKFADLTPVKQDALLKDMEAGKIKLADISSKLFFSSLLNETRNGYFADPKHGGNKNMGAWKMIGYPGMRADYLDWVEVRDKPYPIGPVDLAGRRG
ncbi:MULTISPECIES: gluconate 2-dehydrogenase subunit 3 family protein [unclassified Massilia]|uniref:gluconate 2-dehydrogenase subunit 3 family protein n=1 Tax=unclassified Massilia TaxID=2609279 RepID=UPI001786EAF5|nr:MULTISPECIES: gluconate 2-dehydrogenase subunit 3 family protein [unclassified Massilia]MBD8532174.1 gluconate 2-dehydrogenase subunit 3 family protein [Massilia sp. CFBP 13647]MBD8675568.1 gluconate 2-dehydrogenase subunit 3 family protein [Massilia sp. CFBP 13721]